MKKICLLLVTIVLLPSLSHAGEPSLWITDDVSRTIYEVSLDGTKTCNKFEAFFQPTKGDKFVISPSGITTDTTDGTLWWIDEQPGRVLHYTKTGEQIGFFPTTAFGPAEDMEGIAVDPFDGTLWVVDDPPSDNPDSGDFTINTVYHIKRDGTLISSFPTSNYDPKATSPQAIAVDPFNGTLWITDNREDTIYNVKTDGTLIESFSTLLVDPPADNDQGITVDERDGSVWFTNRGGDREDSYIYNLSIVDGSIFPVFMSTAYDPLSFDPTGIAFDSKGCFSGDDDDDGDEGDDEDDDEDADENRDYRYQSITISNPGTELAPALFPNRSRTRRHQGQVRGADSIPESRPE